MSQCAKVRQKDQRQITADKHRVKPALLALRSLNDLLEAWRFLRRAGMHALRPHLCPDARRNEKGDHRPNQEADGRLG